MFNLWTNIEAVPVKYARNQICVLLFINLIYPKHQSPEIQITKKINTVSCPRRLPLKLELCWLWFWSWFKFWQPPQKLQFAPCWSSTPSSHKGVLSWDLCNQNLELYLLIYPWILRFYTRKWSVLKSIFIIVYQLYIIYSRSCVWKPGQCPKWPSFVTLLDYAQQPSIVLVQIFLLLKSKPHMFSALASVLNLKPW